MLIYYPLILLHPNSYLTVGDGDGIKAFFVYAGHIAHSTSYHQFELMNYPYGQTHIFTDGQTVIAIGFKFLSQWFPFFNTHSMGIYNLMMLMSYPFCAMILSSILKRLQLPLVFIVAGSFAITILSPQYFRLFGHPTLSYVVFVPLIWYLLIRYKESEKKIIFSILIAANTTFWFFIHPYYVMLSVFLTLSYFVVEFLQSTNKRKYLKLEWSYLLLQTGVPLLITRLYIKFYDIHQFRSESPYGFWEYYASWKTIFMPNHGIHSALLRKLFFPNGSQNWEGWAYIGFGAVIVAIYSFVKITRYSFRKNFHLIGVPALPPVLRSTVWAAYLVLLFSMCLPFQLGMHFLVEWFSFLKQFRSLGRFAWIFYYVFSVYSVYILYLFYRKLRMKKYIKTAFILVLTYFVVQISEALPYHNENKENIVASPNYFSKEHLPVSYGELTNEINRIKGNYQCIIPLPFYHVGSENFGKEYTTGSIQMSMVASYWTNMPLLSSSAARSPILEAKNIMQFFSPAFFKKEIEKDLPSRKDFLVLYDKEDLTDIENYWLSISSQLWSNDKFILKRLSYIDVFNYNERKEKEFLNVGFKNFFGDSKVFQDKKFQVIAQNSFDNNKSEQIFKGNGSLEGTKPEFTYLLERKNYSLTKNDEYVVSFWYYNKDELRNQVNCIIEQCDEFGNNCNWDITWNPMECMVINGDWSYVQKKFKPQSTSGQIAVFLIGNKYSKQKLFVDEFSLTKIIPLSANVSIPIADQDKVSNQEYENKLINLINHIKSDSNWLKDIKIKASKNNIPLDSMIKLDAIWVLEQEKLKVH
jgi:hypothetical protein